MSRDYAELERDFIDSLLDDTGRDLAGWMRLIDQGSFAHRNDMIDWLRHQGLTFAKASRLERIHHNGGRPLYGERPQAQVASEPLATAAPPIPEPAPLSPPVATAPPRIEAPGSAAELTAFLARAKGYRPLAELLIRTIRSAVPATVVTVRDGHADLAAPNLYGALAVTAKDVRLALCLGDLPADGEVRRLRLPGTDPTLTHALIINDARRVDPALAALVAKAAILANS